MFEPEAEGKWFAAQGQTGALAWLALFRKARRMAAVGRKKLALAPAGQMPAQGQQSVLWKAVLARLRHLALPKGALFGQAEQLPGPAPSWQPAQQ